jgi:hypothetical protein
MQPLARLPLMPHVAMCLNTDHGCLVKLAVDNTRKHMDDQFSKNLNIIFLSNHIFYYL